MAIYNEILSARFSRSIQKLFSIKGPNPAKQIGGEVMPIHPFFSGAENRILESWNRYGTFITFLAAAGVVNILQFNNPSNSGIVAVFEKISFSSSGTDGVTMTSAPNSPAALTAAISLAGIRWDPRGNTIPVLTASEQQTAAVDLGIARAQLNTSPNSPIDIIFTDIQEFPLLPGDALRIRNVTVNTGSNFNIWWRERALEESEQARG